MKIEVKPIFDIAEVIMGQSPTGDTYNKIGDGLPLLNGPTEFGYYNPKCTMFTIDSRRESKQGDLIFCVRGSTTGRMNWADQIYSLGRGVCAIRGETQLKTKYIKYCLDAYLDGLLQLAGGGTFPNLSKNDIGGFKIPYSEKAESIAAILSAYDDLIENNLKRIKLLEEKAFLRYKQIKSEERIEVEDKLENLIQTVKRKSKIPKTEYRERGEYPIIDQSTDFIGGYTDEKEAVYENPPIIVFGDHTRILKFISFPFACGADGTQLIKPKDDNVCVAYLYFELISCNLSNYHYARHFKFLKEQIIHLPSEKVMWDYKLETNKIFNLIQVLRLQNVKLREARDILLPRLLSGQIAV